MQFLAKTLVFGSLLLCQACIGTDYIDDPIIGEKITISPRIDSLAVGKEQTFTATFFNKYGVNEPAQSLTWRSSDPTKVSVDASGKAKTLAWGRAVLYATNGTTRDSLVLNAGVNNSTGGNGGDTTFLRRGTFRRESTSYNIAGSVQVHTVRGVTQIVTSSDFSVSAGPSLYVLLTNHTTGRYTVTPGGNAVNTVSAQITPNKLGTFTGALTWTVPSNVNPADYKYVVFYCTLGPLFGSAELK